MESVREQHGRLVLQDGASFAVVHLTSSKDDLWTGQFRFHEASTEIEALFDEFDTIVNEGTFSCLESTGGLALRL